MNPSETPVGGQLTDPKAPVRPAPLALVSVPFRGGFIEAAQLEGEVFVPLRPLCDALGVSLQGQLAKLRGKPWACIKMILSQMPGDDQARQFAAVDLRSLPLWLATIEPSRVKPEARPALVAYQREAAEVLYRHFLDTAGPVRPLGVLEQQAAEVARLREEVSTLAREALGLRERLASVGRGLLSLSAAPGAGVRGVGSTRRSREYPPEPPRAPLPPEQAAERVWEAIRRRGLTRVTPRDVSRAVKALRKAQDAVAALEVLCRQGCLTPTRAHHGRAYAVVRADRKGEVS